MAQGSICSARQLSVDFALHTSPNFGWGARKCSARATGEHPVQHFSRLGQVYHWRTTFWREVFQCKRLHMTDWLASLILGTERKAARIGVHSCLESGFGTCTQTWCKSIWELGDRPITLHLQLAAQAQWESECNSQVVLGWCGLL